MNANLKIQKTSGGVVHLGSNRGSDEYERFVPVCGSGEVYAPSTLRSVYSFRKLADTVEVTCKKCLKFIAKHAERLAAEAAEAEQAEPTPEAAPATETTLADQLAQIRANREAEEEARAAARRTRNRSNYAPKPKAAPKPETTRKARTFTFEYNASEGVLIAAALREKAVIERNNAKAYRTNAEIDGTTLVEFYLNQAKLADNRAKLLEDAAERMHKPVREAITKAVTNAIPDEPEPKFHRQVKDAIGLTW